MRSAPSADVDRNRKTNGKSAFVSAPGSGNPVIRREPPPPWHPFPIDVLPEPFRSYSVNAARTIGCDPAFIAPPLLVQAAAAIGNRRRLRLKAGWAEPAVLWVATVGDSGTLKSPGFEAGCRPLDRRQKRLFREHERAMAAYREELAAWKAKPKGEQGPEPERPVCERITCDDATVEALADRFGAAPRGLLLAREELSGWFGSFNQYRNGKGGDVSNWLKMHGARSLTVDRKTGDRKTIYVPRAAVSVVGTIQPGTLRRALTPEMVDSGIGARILLAYPPKRQKRWTEEEIDPVLEGQVDDVVARLLELQPGRDSDGDPEPIDVPLSSDAKALWIQFVNEAGARQASRSAEGIIAAFSKLEGYAARFALIIHHVRHAGGDATVDPWRVDAASVAAGIELSRWFGNEAERVYAMLAESDDERDRRVLCEWIAARGGSASARDLMRSSRRYDTSDAAEGALRDLAAAGLGRWESPPPTGGKGRPSDPRLTLIHDPRADTNSETPEEPAIVSTSAPGEGAESGDAPASDEPLPSAHHWTSEDDALALAAVAQADADAEDEYEAAERAGMQMGGM
jgi:hypothetical protein